MRVIRERFDTACEAYEWIEGLSEMSQNHTMLHFNDDELEIHAEHPKGWYSATCGWEEVEYYTGGGDLDGPYTKTESEWSFSEINEYSMPDHMSPLSELFASFNQIFGAKR
jgi:hypothetical protein